MTYFDGMGAFEIVLFVATVGPPAFALVDAATRQPDAFRAAGKLTKPGWLLILVLATVVSLYSPTPGSILTIAGLVASIVYIVDVRPAVREIAGPRGRNGPRERW